MSRLRALPGGRSIETGREAGHGGFHSALDAHGKLLAQWAV